VQKRRVRSGDPWGTFDVLAHTDDGMRFLGLTAVRLVELAQLPSGTRVLDVATGTGVAALRALRARTSVSMRRKTAQRPKAT